MVSLLYRVLSACPFCPRIPLVPCRAFARVCARLSEETAGLFQDLCRGALKPNERTSGDVISWPPGAASRPCLPLTLSHLPAFHPRCASARFVGGSFSEGCRRNFPRFLCFCSRPLCALGSAGFKRGRERLQRALQPCSNTYKSELLQIVPQSALVLKEG